MEGEQEKKLLRKKNRIQPWNGTGGEEGVRSESTVRWQGTNKGRGDQETGDKKGYAASSNTFPHPHPEPSYYSTKNICSLLL